MNDIILSREWVQDILELCKADKPDTILDSNFIIALCEFYLKRVDSNG